MEGKSKDGFSIVGHTFFGPCENSFQPEITTRYMLLSYRVNVVYKTVKKQVARVLAAITVSDWDFRSRICDLGFITINLTDHHS